MQLHLPDHSRPTPADLAHCREMIREGSKTFFVASCLLPQKVRDAAQSLYGFCRVADDLVDKSDAAGTAIAELRRRLDLIYGGNPLPVPSDRAFAEVVHRHIIPRALPEALIEGFEWDAIGRRYETLGDVRAYAIRVAGTVGAMMAVIMGARSAEAVARACDLGVAMQLTNIARDVGEDARAGRLYLPRQWLRAGGVDIATWLAAPGHTPAIASAVRDLLMEAERLYRRSTSGTAFLPKLCRPAIHASRLMYAEIGHEVERCGHDSITQRAVVPSWRKGQLVLTAALARAGRDDGAPPLEEAMFIVDAVLAAPAAPEPPRGFTARTAWLVDLFTRLEARES